MTSALSRIKVPELALEIESVGRFPATGRASTLWVGVKSNSQLSELWKETGRALESTNQFVIEKRQFTPHITIARCDRQVPEKTIDAFLDRGRQFTTPMFKVPRFVLYSSDLQAEGPVYHPESCFDLNS